MAFHYVKLSEKGKPHAAASQARQLYQERMSSEATTIEGVQSPLDNNPWANCWKHVGEEAMFDALWHCSSIVGVERFPFGVDC